MVEIYHSLGQQVTIDTVLNEGLKSRGRLVQERKLESISKFLFPDHLNSIYFRWWDPVFARTLNTPWISIEVDPYETKAYNAEFRQDINRELYLASAMLLSELIEKKEQGEAMKRTVPLKMVIYHPTTAEPILVDFDDERVHNRHCFYSNEIIISKDLIPPTEFKNYHRGKT